MLKFLTILIPIIFGFLSYKYTARRLVKKLESQSSPMKDPIINSLVNKISFSLELPKIEIYILEDLNLNGLASPDGKVFITRGFMDKYYSGFVSAEELIGVVAHELGHLALGHTKKRMIAYTTQNFLQMSLGLVLSRIIPFVGNYISTMILRLIAAKLSRMDEFEADKYATALMLKIGLGIKPLIKLFNKLKTLHNDHEHGLTWLQSHPTPTDRILAIKKLNDYWGENRNVGLKI